MQMTSCVDIYTDASVCVSRNLISIAFIAKAGKETLHTYSRTYSGHDNNHGEIVAILEALSWVDSFTVLNDPRTFYIKSDSKDSVEAIKYARQGSSYSAKSLYLSLKTKLNDRINLVHVQRSRVSEAHNLARRELKLELEKLCGSKDKQKEERKKIDRAWILAQWLKKESS
jgi:ribonuclease HI